MKKILVLLLALLMFQQAYNQELRFGIVADPQIGWLVSDITKVQKDGANLGVNVGLIMDKYFAENYAITTGLSITNLGGKLLYQDSVFFETNTEEVGLEENSSVNYKLQYLKVPIGLKFKTNEIGYLTYYAQLGLDGYINVKARMDSESNDFVNENISKNINLFHLDYFIGAGAEYSLGGNAAITFGIIYANGFVDITDHETDKITIGNVALRLGIMF